MTDRLHERLVDAAQSIPPPDLASAAWAIGRTRRRRVVAAVAGVPVLALLVVAGAVVVTDRRNGPPPVPAEKSLLSPDPASTDVTTGSVPAPSRTPPTGQDLPDPPVDRAPALAEEGRLALTPSALPARLELTKQWPSLAADPLVRAVALFQTGTDLGGGIVVLGSDGRLRSLGVPLEPSADSGNAHRALQSNSLRADGRAAAFPQRDAVVVVDLLTAVATRYQAPGFNEQVSWHPDGKSLYVGSNESPFVIELETGSLRSTRARGWDAFFTDAGELFTLGDDGLVRFDVATGKTVEVATEASVEPTIGTPSTRGDLVARLTWHRSEESIVLVDVETRRIVRRLTVAGTPNVSGCCQTVGWLGQDIVVFYSETTTAGRTTHRLLGWNTRTGAVTRVADLDAGAAVSLARL